MSVAFVSGKSEAEIIDLGKQVVRHHRTATHLYGWAGFSETDIPDDLTTARNDDPFEGHANIVGWDRTEREKRKNRAQKLSEKSKSHPIEPPIHVLKRDGTDT